MEKQQKTAPGVEVQPSISSIETEKVLDCKLFNDLINFQLKNNPDLAGKTKMDIARECDISESTMKNILSGKNSNPHVGTLRRIILRIGGGSVDRIIGLAPPRDFEKEDAVYDADLVHAANIRVAEKEAVIDNLHKQLMYAEADKDRLRKLILEKSEIKSKIAAEAEAMKKEIADLTSKSVRLEKKVLRRDIIILALILLSAVLFKF
jgi:transcriptional regulator with XRE-family HTH domain